MRSASWFKKFSVGLSLLITVMFCVGIAWASLGDRWAVSNGLGTGTFSWRILGTSSPEVVKGTAYANDLVPGVNNTYSIGSAQNKVANLYVSNLTTAVVNGSTNGLTLTNLTVSSGNSTWTNNVATTVFAGSLNITTASKAVTGGTGTATFSANCTGGSNQPATAAVAVWIPIKIDGVTTYIAGWR